MNREAFLERIRGALGCAAGDPVAPPPPLPAREVVAPAVAALIGAAALRDHFSARAEAAGVRVHRVVDVGTAVEVAAALLTTLGSSAVADASGLARAVLAASGRPQCAPADAEVGVTVAWRGVAETGTVVLRSELGRTPGLLPPLHLVLLAVDDLRAGLTELYADVAAAGDLPAALVQITGPSRTADIEVTLVTGVHGPGEVHVLLIG